MDCKECRIQLDAYLDQELSEAEQVRVEVHLQSCGKCQQILQQKEMLKRELSQFQYEAPEFVASAVQKIGKEQVVRRRKLRNTAVGVCAAAVCLLIALIGPVLKSQQLTKKSMDVVEEYAQQTEATEPRAAAEEESENCANGTCSAGVQSEPVSGDNLCESSSEACLIESIQLEMQKEDMQWLIVQLRERLGESAEVHIEETETGYVLYDIVSYEEQLRQYLEEKAYTLPENVAEMLCVELIALPY